MAVDMFGIERRFKALVTKQKGLDGGLAIDGAQSFVDDLGFDSLDSVELAMAVEDEFGIGITDSDEAELFTVRDYVNLLVDRMALGSGAGRRPVAA